MIRPERSTMVTDSRSGLARFSRSSRPSAATWSMPSLRTTCELATIFNSAWTWSNSCSTTAARAWFDAASSRSALSLARLAVTYSNAPLYSSSGSTTSSGTFSSSA